MSLFVRSKRYDNPMTWHEMKARREELRVGNNEDDDNTALHRIAAIAVDSDDRRILEHFCTENIHPPNYTEAAKIAAGRGSIEYLEYFRMCGHNFSRGCFRVAAEFGHIACLDWVLRHAPDLANPTPFSNDIHSFLGRRAEEVCKWLFDRGFVMSKQVYNKFVSDDNWPMVDWLIENDCPRDNMMFIRAIRTGNVDRFKELAARHEPTLEIAQLILSIIPGYGGHLTYSSIPAVRNAAIEHYDNVANMISAVRQNIYFASDHLFLFGQHLVAPDGTVNNVLLQCVMDPAAQGIEGGLRYHIGHQIVESARSWDMVAYLEERDPEQRRMFDDDDLMPVVMRGWTHAEWCSHAPPFEWITSERRAVYKRIQNLRYNPWIFF